MSSDRADELRRLAERAKPSATGPGRVVGFVQWHLEEILAAERVWGEAHAEGRIQELERLRERTEKNRDEWRVLYDQADARAKRLDKQLQARHTMREAQEAEGEQVKIMLGHESGVAWTIGDLEELVYRLRLGGGTDDTHVELSRSEVSAVLPAPNLISLHPVGRRTTSGDPDATPVRREPQEARRRVVLDWRLTVGLVLVVLSLVFGLVVL